MARKCEKIIASKDGKYAIYVDAENKEEIVNYWKSDERHRKKFRFISDVILGGHRKPEVYDKEEINDKCKNVTAMKFFKGQENDRIYCKEVKSKEGTLIIVSAILHLRKKSTKLTNTEIALIEKVGGYEYEIQG